MLPVSYKDNQDYTKHQSDDLFMFSSVHTYKSYFWIRAPARGHIIVEFYNVSLCICKEA